MNLLVTGGAGYIGSHTVVELINAGHSVVVVDSLVNSYEEAIRRVEVITGTKIPFYCADIKNRSALESIFKDKSFDCCFHFAGLKAVRESIQKPWKYYNNNLCGTLTLLDVLKDNGCKNIVFSSSATVYGKPEETPINESCPKGICTNPYGQTKSMIENILTDIYNADLINQVENPWNIVILRYFNPIGAHKSGLIGENPVGIPNNLMPYITQVASGRLKQLTVFGDNYNTPDGTCIRDYIHVVDLARGHVKALQAIERKCGIEIYNLGTGRGYSVLELIEAFEKANGVKIPYVIGSRREGDIDICFSDSNKAWQQLGWKTEYDVLDMCRDSWNWQKKNPNGY